MSRPTAASVAAIELSTTYVFFSGPQLDGLTVIRDGELLLPGTVDSVSVNVAVDESGMPSITGIIAIVSGSGSAERYGKTIRLFPGFVEIIVAGKRIQLACSDLADISTFWCGVGMRGSGEASSVQGVRTLHVLLAAGLGATADLTWDDTGITESLLD